MFTVALFTKARKGKQSRCPQTSVHERIMKMWYIYTTKHSSVVKLKFSGKGIELKIIILSEVMQIHEGKHSIFALIYGYYL